MIAGDGDTATVSCGRVGGLGRFPLVRIVSRPISRCAVDSHHSAEMLPMGNKLCSNRVHRFARLKTQGKHRKTLHKTPHQQGYTRADVPSSHRLAIGEHLRKQRPDFIDCQSFASDHILLVLLRGSDFGSDVHELRISSNARF